MDGAKKRDGWCEKARWMGAKSELGRVNKRDGHSVRVASAVCGLQAQCAGCKRSVRVASAVCGLLVQCAGCKRSVRIASAVCGLQARGAGTNHERCERHSPVGVVVVADHAHKRRIRGLTFAPFMQGGLVNIHDSTLLVFPGEDPGANLLQTYQDYQRCTPSFAV
jgi:hypothetical protein